MIHIARAGSIDQEAQLSAFRKASVDVEARAWRQLYAAAGMDRVPRRWPNGLPIVGGGAPVLPTTLSVLKANVVKNTWTTFATIINDDGRGPFAADYFNTLGATWTMEAMGFISSTATPTLQFRAAFGTALASIATMLAQSAVLTTISGLANIPYYLKILGVTKAAAGAASTMVVTGYLLSQIVTAAANNIVSWLSNATPPTAITTDLSASAYLDLQAQWGTSAAGNQITTNAYALQSQYS